ncbi:IQ-DOMAIN 31-like protein [Tanacetum coccineum]
MGKVSRWFRGVLGMKKDKENIDNSNAIRKNRWCFGKCMKDSSQRATLENDSTRMRSCMSTSDKEQNKHHIAIAATAIAAADAAVAGPQPLVAVVRLSTDDRGTLFSGTENWAATKIQSVYRGHLARRAMRALRGLVKFQALVKGFLVRKRVAATLYSMIGLIMIEEEKSIASDSQLHMIQTGHTLQPHLQKVYAGTHFLDLIRIVQVTRPTRNHLARNKGRIVLLGCKSLVLKLKKR